MKSTVIQYWKKFWKVRGNMKRFENKVAIVTGAARGLGAQYAIDLAVEGAKVILVGRDETGLQNVKKTIEDEGGSAVYYKVDISDVIAVNACVDDVVRTNGKIDILINNAAYYKGQSVMDTIPEDWAMQIKINLNGTFYFTKAVLPHMLERKYGKILNISSAGAKIFFPGFAAYGASKGGIVAFSNILSEEVKYDNINVNSIYLGMVNTEKTRERIDSDAAVVIPLDEMMQPPEVSKVVLFLVSDDAAPIKGAAIDVFGNRY